MSPEKEFLMFEDSEYIQNTLSGLNMLRRNRHFCDVVLQIGKQEIHAHRPVLACASPYLFDLFSLDAENGHEYRFKLNGGFEKEAFEVLVNYAYTARLDIPADQVKAVYVAAVRLKMERVAQKCGEFLVKRLSPNNCIGIRSIPGLSNDVDLVGVVDAFIQQEVHSVCQSKELQALPRIQVEVLRNSQGDIEVIQGQHLCNMVVEWLKQQLDNEEIAVNTVTEKVHMLYVNPDHSLHDCNDIENGAADDSDIIQDYKKKSKQYALPVNKGRKKQISTPVPAKPRQLLYSRSTSDSSICSDGGDDEGQWKLIAYHSTGENSMLAVAVINSNLFVLSLKLRLNLPLRAARSPVVSEVPKGDHQQEDYYLLAKMNSKRCSVGTVEIDGMLLVCGGYDRGSCLNMVQAYCPQSNFWRPLQSMCHARGRFDITVVGKKVFAVGGCDGTNELASVECYDSTTHKWSMLPQLSVARSNAGVCTLDGKVYCVGGWNGHVGTRRCDIFDPDTGAWIEIAPLLTGRSQAGVCSLKGFVYAVGGCDHWNCLSSVEKYDPHTNSWSYVASLNTARRGCGCTVYNGKIYVVGGTNGSRSLCTIEIYDPETNSWSAGPNLTCCRANVGVAVVGDKLYAVGGFTGTVFLNTIEYLDSRANEWTTFMATSRPSSERDASSGDDLE